MAMAQHSSSSSMEPDADGPWPAPDTSQLITEDGKPVDSVFAEKQMRLLTEALYSGWRPGRRFFAAANVGVFAIAKNPALVPDAFLSLDVEPKPVTGPERRQSYFVWEYGKPPDVVIEIVSDTYGDELSGKLREYERMRVTHYVVFDPLDKTDADEVTSFTLMGGVYVLQPQPSFALLGLRLVIWEGVFEDVLERWLRWADLDGVVIPTGDERAATAETRALTEAARATTEAARATTAEARATTAEARATTAEARAAMLEARLRELGIEPGD
ncbi:MAG: Uma2 family endonuclease [Labilithrix sp.]|nr:Uma2 family endonuclease [Labilithrix sp.]MCW5812054.1 Uma2 family endonuclease [Labilithrix sp.]